jgi:hypothetical protein
MTIKLKQPLNTAMLEARRRHSRAVLAVAQPWLTIAVIIALLAIGLFVYALFHNNFRALSLLESLLLFVYGLVSVIASMRALLYRRSHSLKLTEPSAALRWD